MIGYSIEDIKGLLEVAKEAMAYRADLCGKCSIGRICETPGMVICDWEPVFRSLDNLPESLKNHLKETLDEES